VQCETSKEAEENALGNDRRQKKKSAVKRILDVMVVLVGATIPTTGHEKERGHDV
jgi:hypothetical protein